MTQNAYDDITLFKSYEKCERSLSNDSYLNGLIPNEINGYGIDFGCGDGWFCREMIKMGATKVVGMDLSNNMIEKANQLNTKFNISNKKLHYEIQDLSNLIIKPEYLNSFNFAFSSYVIQYLPNLESFFKNVYSLLKPGATFVFTTEHPIRSSPICIDIEFIDHTFTGEESSRKVWPLSDYSNEGIRIRNWLGYKGIVKYHHTMSTYINTLIKVGFKIEYLGENVLTGEQFDLNASENKLEIERNRPYGLYIKVSK